jgi:hypothetical protein
MAQIIRVIESENALRDYDPAKFHGQLFVSAETGEIFTPEYSDELGGIRSFFKKLGTIALPLAGAIAAPFTGGMSVAAATALMGALSAGGQIVSGFISSSGNSNGGAQAKGLPAIQAKGEQVIAAFGELKQKVSSGEIVGQDAYTAADKLAGLFDNTSEFFPAQHGKDADALNRFRSDAKILAGEVKTLADNVGQKLQAAQAAQTAQTAQTAGNTGNAQTGGGSLPFGLSWAGVALGVGAFYFVTRR